MVSNILFDYRAWYFLIGTLLFLVPRFMNSISVFGLEPNETPRNNTSTFMYFIVGAIFYMFMIEDLITAFLYTGSAAASAILLEIVPVVLIFLIGFVFSSEAFVKPTKNTLITLLIISVIGLPLSFLLFHNTFIDNLFSYSYVLGPVIAIVIAAAGGYGIHRILRKKLPDFNQDLWSVNSLWKITNNPYLLGTIIIVSLLEIFMQLNGYSFAYPLVYLL
ncbi:MAG: hypothetical protein ACTSRW_12720 [Candidatus Helarchaeota archaeon]